MVRIFEFFAVFAVRRLTAFQKDLSPAGGSSRGAAFAGSAHIVGPFKEPNNQPLLFYHYELIS